MALVIDQSNSEFAKEDPRTRSNFLKFRAGDSEAGNEFARLEIPRLERVAAVRLAGQNRVDPQDLVQETLLKICQKRLQYDPGRELKPWINTIVSNASIDMLRRDSAASRRGDRAIGGERNVNSIASGVLGVSKDPAASIEFNEMKEKVRRAIEMLSDPIREAVELVYLQGATYSEAAQKQGIPIGTMKSRLVSAKRQIIAACPELSDYYASLGEREGLDHLRYYHQRSENRNKRKIS